MEKEEVSTTTRMGENLDESSLKNKTKNLESVKSESSISGPMSALNLKSNLSEITLIDELEEKESLGDDDSLKNKQKFENENYEDKLKICKGGRHLYKRKNSRKRPISNVDSDLVKTDNLSANESKKDLIKDDLQKPKEKKEKLPNTQKLTSKKKNVTVNKIKSTNNPPKSQALMVNSSIPQQVFPFFFQRQAFPNTKNTSLQPSNEGNEKKNAVSTDNKEQPAFFPFNPTFLNSTLNANHAQFPFFVPQLVNGKSNNIMNQNLNYQQQIFQHQYFQQQFLNYQKQQQLVQKNKQKNQKLMKNDVSKKNLPKDEDGDEESKETNTDKKNLDTVDTKVEKEEIEKSIQEKIIASQQPIMIPIPPWLLMHRQPSTAFIPVNHVIGDIGWQEMHDAASTLVSLSKSC
ncbi:hypothetical protein HDU92_008198 [Lobulomyces angularis]|nr:hypothetical protein HDU92_008198 [Lobulomyces angularis]